MECFMVIGTIEKRHSQRVVLSSLLFNAYLRSLHNLLNEHFESLHYFDNLCSDTRIVKINVWKTGICNDLPKELVLWALFQYVAGKLSRIYKITSTVFDFPIEKSHRNSHRQPILVERSYKLRVEQKGVSEYSVWLSS